MKQLFALSMLIAAIVRSTNMFNHERIVLFPVPEQPVEADSTFRSLLNRLIDIGYQTVGVTEQCRENSICNSANYIVQRVPDYVIEQGVEQLNELPPSMFGDHEYTDAWMLGMGAQNDNKVCDMIYHCLEKNSTNTMEMARRLIAFVDQFTFENGWINTLEH
ncbi:hypothetical protein BLOT_010415 [Blomia tropicalis]|nr:hypothetical protein BLOT_010415 [Blomia tropicalis]